MTDSEFINERLFQLYGRDQLTQQQKYRVVRSEEQTEKRYGSYDLLSKESGIWLGVKEGLVEIQKYWYLKPCWLLERVEANLNRQDTLYDKWTYEPILTFLDKEDNPLPLNWRAIEFAINHIEKAEKRIRTESEDLQEEEKRLEKESEVVYGVLDKPDPTKELPTFTNSTLIPKG